MLYKSSEAALCWHRKVDQLHACLLNRICRLKINICKLTKGASLLLVVIVICSLLIILLNLYSFFYHSVAYCYNYCTHSPNQYKRNMGKTARSQTICTCARHLSLAQNPQFHITEAKLIVIILKTQVRTGLVTNLTVKPC